MLKSIINSASTITLGLAITFENPSGSTLDLAQMLETPVTTESLALAQYSPSDKITSHGRNWIKAEDHDFDGIDSGNCIVSIDMTKPYFPEGKTTWSDIKSYKDFCNTHDYDAFRIH